MAVNRVSPLPDPPDGYSVKDGYLWTPLDPPGASDPVVVRHVDVYASAEVKFSHTSRGNATFHAAEAYFGRDGVQSGDVEMDVSTVALPEGYTLAGGVFDVRLRRAADGTWYAFVWYSPASPHESPTCSVAGADPFQTESGPLVASSTGNNTATGRVYAQIRVFPRWVRSDEVVSVPPVRRISYLGDW